MLKTILIICTAKNQSRDARRNSYHLYVTDTLQMYQVLYLKKENAKTKFSPLYRRCYL